jgi:hypothetical protein
MVPITRPPSCRLKKKEDFLAERRLKATHVAAAQAAAPVVAKIVAEYVRATSVRFGWIGFGGGGACL